MREVLHILILSCTFCTKWEFTRSRCVLCADEFNMIWLRHSWPGSSDNVVGIVRCVRRNVARDARMWGNSKLFRLLRLSSFDVTGILCQFGAYWDYVLKYSYTCWTIKWWNLGAFQMTWFAASNTKMSFLSGDSSQFQCTRTSSTHARCILYMLKVQAKHQLQQLNIQNQITEFTFLTCSAHMKH